MGAQNRRTTNNSDDSEDDRICEIDKRIAARKAAALAEDKAANDPSQYVSNRAKMIKDQSSNSPGNLRRCYFLPFHSILYPSIPKIEEWKDIVILKLLFPSTFILILKIAISFQFYCYFLPFRNKRSGRK